jgi:hypothetical protein
MSTPTLKELEDMFRKYGQMIMATGWPQISEAELDAAFKDRAERKRLVDEGWEEVNESGGPLWQLVRGARWRERITDVVIAPGGKSLFIKTAEPTP